MVRKITEFMMKKLVTLSLVSALALGAAACSKPATNETVAENANEVVATEGNLTENATAADNVAIDNAVDAANNASAELNNAATANSSNSH